ncbi:hypothetical protein [Granulicella tundricola]|uniref:Uncharacterized protein n=1 Tax=Granulicella tundricola (strain ATCC BAA-1859 / DSM 23138 / MP5ACTX9) TaxID=1198114 RepID=E8WYH3_GRATM|nr:hypothetical protein [Granulicella tundricola]ADW69879.1 hypothetical protein AciX9_2856 [Granulicella tundricola MP5ACTX9]
MTSPSTWTAQILTTPPLIAPARHFIYPQQIPGEEDALARGALNLLIQPVQGGTYLITCALGFKDPSLPTAIHPCPNPDEICAIAGGYAYLSNTLHPETCTLLPLKPVVEFHQTPEALIFIGFHTIIAWGREGLLWQTFRLSYEGLKVTAVTETLIEGLGWDLMTDKEIPFAVDLATGHHSGGAFPPSATSSTAGKP